MATERGTSTDDLTDRQAALGLDLLLLGAPRDLRVAQHQRIHVLAADNHRQAAQGAELRSRQAHPARVVHHLDHPLGLVLQRLVEIGDRERGRAQHGVAELADVLERGESPALEDGVVEGAR